MDKCVKGEHQWRFDTKEVLGQGGYASICKVLEKNNKKVTGYVIKRSKNSDDRKRSAIEEEIRILKGLNNLDCVPKVIDSGLEEKFSWYIMEELDTIDFKDIHLFSDAIRIIDTVASALIQIHGKKVAHRDIKLENILRRKNGELVICDFGVSVDDKTAEELIPFPINIRRGINIPDEMMKANLLNSESDYIETYQKSDIYMFGFFILQILLGDEEADSRISFDFFSRKMKSRWNVGIESIFLYKLMKNCTEQMCDDRCNLEFVNRCVKKVIDYQNGNISNEMRIEIRCIQRNIFINDAAINADSISFSMGNSPKDIRDFLSNFSYEGLLIEIDDRKMEVVNGILDVNILRLDLQTKRTIELVVEELRVFPKSTNLAFEIVTGMNRNEGISQMDYFLGRKTIIEKGKVIRFFLVG